MDAEHAVDPRTFVTGPERADGPRIAVVVSLTFPGMNADSLSLMQSFTEVAFAAVRAAGGRPRLIDSSAETLFAAADAFEQARGVLFLGGGDVDGALYGAEGTPPNSYGVDRRADDYCIELVREAAHAELPVLAICRGSQLLNVAFGGTLIPDIDAYRLHRGGPGLPVFLDEEVRLLRGSIVHDMYGRDLVTVRSGHHQAVDRVGDGLVATAHAHDGVVEGTQHREARWIVGMQWHPEEPRANTRDRRLVFDAFLAEARR